MSNLVYGPGDRVEIKIQDLTITVTPLSVKDKMKLGPLADKAKEEDPEAQFELIFNAIKLSVKEVKGFNVPGANGEPVPYSPSFDANGKLSDDDVERLLNLGGEKIQGLSAVCASLLGEFSGTFTNSETGEDLEGVSIISVKGPEQGKE